MHSKARLDKSQLNCCKCNRRCHQPPLELPCQHFICIHCVNSLKFKIFFHCKLLKVFLRGSNNRVNDNDDKFDHSTILFNKIKKTELGENYLLSRLGNPQIYLNSKQTALSLLKNYFTCPSCKQTLFSEDEPLDMPVTLDCFHTVCRKCLKSAQCPICNLKFHVEDSYFQIDRQIIELTRKLAKAVSDKQSSILSRLEAFFAKFDTVLTELVGRKSFQADREQENVEARPLNSKLELKIETDLNRRREELFKIIDKSLRIDLEQSKYRNQAVASKCSFYFRQKYLQYTDFNLIGKLKIANNCLVNKIKHLHLNNETCSKSFNLQAKHITYPQIQITGFNWLRQSPKADFLVPYSQNKIFYIYNADNVSQSYRFKIANPNLPIKEKKVKHVEYEFDFKMKLEYARIDYELNRLVLFFECIYDKQYCVKIFNFFDMRQMVAYRFFGYFIESFLFSSCEVISWSSLTAPFLRYFSSNLEDLVERIAIFYDPIVFTKFYMLADCSKSYMIFHNQDTIGIVDKTRGRLLNEINTKIYEDIDDVIRNELHQQRMRAYQSQSKSEYFNMKCLGNDEHLLVSTWSRIYVFSMSSGCLLAKNNIHIIPNNVWLLPNRLYLNKDEDIVFFDTSTSFLTFI